MIRNQATCDEGIASHETVDEVTNERTTFANDPAMCNVHDKLHDHVALYGYDRNINADSFNLRRMYNDCARFCSSSLFHRKLLNGEKTPRPWLVYLKCRGVVYCVPCLLFEGESSFAKDGFKAGACFRRPKFTGFCEAFLEGK